MNSISRRSFFSQATVGLATLTTLGIPANTEPIYTVPEWKMAEFQQLLKQRAQVKQMYDVANIEDGNFLLHIKNSLDGLQFGFGVPANRIKIVSAMRGAANLVNFDDYVWEKYNLGELLHIKDLKTGKPATRNIYYPSDAGNPPKYASQNPNDRKSLFQDTSIQALQSRGVQFLSCHMATEGWAQHIIQKKKLSLQPEEVTRDMQSHILPGVLIVPSMVAAVALLQSQGRFSYIRV